MNASSAVSTTPTPSTEPPPVPESLRIEAWVDPVVDNLGHDPRSHYVEQFWLGVLGPSTTWLVRRVADRFDRQPDGFDLHLRSTAVSLGLGMRDGRHSPFMRAIDRSCQFGLARRIDRTTLAVRRRVPPVTQGQLKRMPEPIQQAHARWREAELRSTDQQQSKARRLALTLLEIGEDLDVAERQLCACAIEQPEAQRALSWAHSRHRAAQAAASASSSSAS